MKLSGRCMFTIRDMEIARPNQHTGLQKKNIEQRTKTKDYLNINLSNLSNFKLFNLF